VWVVKQLVTVAALERAALALALRQQYPQQLILIELLKRARHVSLIYAAGQLANRSLIGITDTVGAGVVTESCQHAPRIASLDKRDSADRGYRVQPAINVHASHPT
jgi:hypothetical protein